MYIVFRSGTCLAFWGSGFAVLASSRESVPSIKRPAHRPEKIGPVDLGPISCMVLCVSTITDSFIPLVRLLHYESRLVTQNMRPIYVCDAAYAYYPNLILRPTCVLMLAFLSQIKTQFPLVNTNRDQCVLQI
jgi:hypothetical protein